MSNDCETFLIKHPWQVLEYFFDILLPKSGMTESDRQLLRDKTLKHDVYRAYRGEADCSWMARLQKSAISTFHLLEARRFLFLRKIPRFELFM